MDDVVEMLVKLGLSEYEARVYAALVRLGKASVREIHDASGVPRARVYDVARKLSEKGFVDVEDGEVKKFKAVDPRRAIGRVISEFNRTATRCIEKLESMKPLAIDSFSPALVIRGGLHDRIAELLEESEEVTMVTTNVSLVHKIVDTVRRKGYSGKIVIYTVGIEDEDIENVKNLSTRLSGSVEIWNVEEVTAILKKMYFEELMEEGSKMRIEAVLIFDGKKSMIIIDEGKERSAVLITLPIIAYVQRNMIKTHMEGIAQRIA